MVLPKSVFIQHTILSGLQIYYFPARDFWEVFTGWNLSDYSQSRQIVCYNNRITLKIDRYLDSIAAKEPVKFQSDWKALGMNITASSL